jgi:hypothetical protein
MSKSLSFVCFVLVLGLLATTASSTQQTVTRSIERFTVQVPPDAPREPPPLARPVAPIERLTPGYREIYWDRRPIADKLLPSDTVVQVYMNVFPPFVVMRPDATDEEGEMAFWTRRAAVAGVMRVVDRASTLAIDDSWLVTNVTARVEDAIKATTGGRGARGALVRWRETGGTLTINDVRVVARHSVRRSTEVGRDYLVFLSQDDVDMPVAAFEAVEGNTLHSMTTARLGMRPTFTRDRALAAVREAR